LEEELVIDESNFDEYFRDARQSKPNKEEVIACYASVAFFRDGPEKRNVIDLLLNTDKMEATSQVMRKLLYASELDAFRIPRIMAEDLAHGMTRDKVAFKEYKFKVEIYYYTKMEYVPKDDPHWTVISLINLDEFTDTQDGLTISSKIIWPEDKED